MPTLEADPILIGAQLFTLTGGEDKDHDTGIFIEVRTKDQTTLLAKVDDGANCEACKYPDNSPNFLDLAVQSQSPKSACADFTVSMKTRAHGNDKWEIQTARVTLTFRDGQNLLKEKANFTLESHGSQFSNEATF